MKLQNSYPVYPYWVNQKYGNVAPLYTSMGLLGHDGQDLLAGEQICYAANEGVVTEKSLDYNRGLGVYVTTDQKYDVGLDQPYNVALVYWHFKQDDVNVGDRIKVGDRLGITDNTGASSGNHLHFAVQPRKVDASGALVIAFPNNGYRGFIDPEPFWNNTYADGHTIPTPPKFYFPKILQMESIGVDVLNLQKMLKYEYCFPYTPTGFYGEKTRQGVYNWQIHNNVAPLPELIKLQGKYFGPASIAYANKKYS